MVNFQQMQALGVIDPEDMKEIHFVETAQEAWQVIQDFYQLA